jgi:transposase
MFLLSNTLIDAPGWEVWMTRVEDDNVIFRLVEVEDKTVCPFCGSDHTNLHKQKILKVRDLPILGKNTILELDRSQHCCKNCHRYFTRPSEKIDFPRSLTERFKDYIMERLKNSTIERVAEEENLTADQVRGILESKLKGKKPNRKARKIGIDEFSRRKGKGDYVTVVCNLDTGEILEIIDSHQQDEIIKVLMQWSLEEREAITEVSVDMWGGFTKVIKTVFPKARIVYDRFHVMKILNEELNKIRKECSPRLKKLKIKGIRRLILKNGESLTPEEKELLEIILKCSPRLRNAYLLKEEFRQIYETHQPPEVAKASLEAWLGKASKIYSDIITTVKDHFDGICNYFYDRTTNGKMEGINNKIKVIKRQAYGFTNFEHLSMRIFLAFSH